MLELGLQLLSGQAPPSGEDSNQSLEIAPSRNSRSLRSCPIHQAHSCDVSGHNTFKSDL